MRGVFTKTKERNECSSISKLCDKKYKGKKLNKETIEIIKTSCICETLKNGKNEEKKKRYQ